MKKIFLTFLIFLSLSYAKDLDILSIASNGSLSDKTSHKLNDDELKQVVGGIALYTDGVVKYNIFGGTRYTLFHQWNLYLEDEEKRLGTVKLAYNETLQQQRNNYKDLTYMSKNGQPVIITNYDSRFNEPTVTLHYIDKNTGIYWGVSDSFGRKLISLFKNSYQYFETLKAFRNAEAQLGLRAGVR